MVATASHLLSSFCLGALHLCGLEGCHGVCGQVSYVLLLLRICLCQHMNVSSKLYSASSINCALHATTRQHLACPTPHIVLVFQCKLCVRHEQAPFLAEFAVQMGIVRQLACPLAYAAGYISLLMRSVCLCCKVREYEGKKALQVEAAQQFYPSTRLEKDNLSGTTRGTILA